MQYPKNYIFSTGEVSRLLGFSAKTLLRWEASGKIPKAKRGSNGRRYYDLADVENLMSQK